MSTLARVTRARPGARRAVAMTVLLALLLAGCGSSSAGLRGFLTSTYQVDSRTGDNVMLSSPKPPDQVVSEVVGRYPPLSRVPGNGVEVMRYADDVLAVQPGPGGGSILTLDDEETGSNRWIPIVGVGLGRSRGFGGGSGGVAGGDDFRGGGSGEGK